MNVRRTFAVAALVAAVVAPLTATSAMAGSVPDQPTGYVAKPYCTTQGSTIRPLSYVDMGNWTSNGSHRFVVKNKGRVVKDITLSDHSGTSFMLDLAPAGVTKGNYSLSMTVDGKPALNFTNQPLGTIKGSFSCTTKGSVSVYLGEQKHGFCYNGVTSVGIYADSTFLLGKPMALTYTLDGKTRTARVPANGWWGKQLAVAPGSHTLTVSGTKLKTVTYKFTATEQCPGQG